MMMGKEAPFAKPLPGRTSVGLFTYIIFYSRLTSLSTWKETLLTSLGKKALSGVASHGIGVVKARNLR